MDSGGSLEEDHGEVVIMFTTHAEPEDLCPQDQCIASHGGH